MGSVWEGVHTSLGNRVACKFIEPEFVESQDALQRFENEARAAASLRSKHVVDVYDHGVMPDGRPYIVMEFLTGEPLDARIHKLGTLTLAQTASIVAQVSRALSQAHAAGIVHRDLKPENVFLVWDDEDQTDIAKVVDFGIAKFTSADKGISSSTKTGSILGTPYYMSPEQARGLKNVDSRSDLWSLGVIAYEALAGRRPFDGEAVGDLLVHICTTDPMPLTQIRSDLPPVIDHWIAKALCRDVNQRFQNVREMADSLVSLSGIPGRGSYGPAAGQLLSQSGSYSGAGAQSSKLTSGALTHAAMETEVVPGRRSGPLPILLGGVGILAAAGIVFALMGASDEPTEQEALVASEVSLDPPPAPTPAAPEPAAIPEPERPEPRAEEIQKEKEEALVKEEAAPPKVEPRPIVRPRPAYRPPPPRPAPQPIALPSPAPSPAPSPSPAPVAAPAPTPAPAPSPAPPSRPAPRPRPKGLDLGY